MKRLLLIASILLGGCATEPSNLILQPVDTYTQNQAVSTTAVAISSVDLRTETYLGRIRKKDEAAKLLSPANNPRVLVQNGVTKGFSTMGYQINASAEQTMVLQLDKLQVDVTQNTLDHNGTSIAAVTVKLANNKQELTKRFASKGSFTGVMKIDAAQMERELNDRVQQLVNAIINDPEIHQFLAQGAN